MITKRDGRQVKFDPEKIKKALDNCFIAVDGEITDKDQELIQKNS